jgi:hypothetical protein
VRIKSEGQKLALRDLSTLALAALSRVSVMETLRFRICHAWTDGRESQQTARY